ncbi:MAG: hypothetical protein HXS52_01985 [Theionarchaea archaeon]|nr:hypothetical protein [Theionarchaea archaeon]MBU7036674.1 hypothetical protein [Theionarchaea archaeon]
MKGYFSLRNSNIFVFMLLSVIPAALCQLLYTKLNVIHVKGIIYTFFFRFNYASLGIPVEQDYLVQAFVVLFFLNLGLIAIKIIGWGLSGEEKDVIVSDSEKYFFLAMVALYVLILVLAGPPFLTWIFIPLLVLLYMLTRTSSKVVILFTLLLLNLILFAFYYRHFDFNVVIGGRQDGILTFMAKIGFSWLYILPYNFFIFFPLVIATYFLDFRYPEKYISSFFDVVFHENMVAVFVGLLLNVTLSVIPLFIVMIQPDTFIDPSRGIVERMIFTVHNTFAQEESKGLGIFETIALLHFWIGSFTLWFTPFFVSFAQLETKFEASFDRNLRETIQKMKDHIVIIGFGNLGRKVCSDLIERDVVSRKNDTFEIFTPDLEVRKICRSLLVVDSKDQLFDRVHTDPILQNVGVARRRIGVAGEREDILIPAIIGDINSETTRESAQLKRSKLFISAPSDYTATFILSKFANRNNLSSIISVEDSAQKDYFSPKVTAHDTFLIYPAFQEGVSLGRIVSLCYFRILEEKKESESGSLNIVICGDGKQIHYIMETFWMETERTGLANQWISKTAEDPKSPKREIYDLPVTILTESVELEKRSRKKKDQEDEAQRKIVEIIRRSSLVGGNDAHIRVDVILDFPDRLKRIEEIIASKEPEIIVVTSNKIQDVSRIFHEWVVAIERYNSSKDRSYKPAIIVGVLGNEYEEVQDILLYYAKMEPESGLKFPIQFLDAAVRVYDDSTEKIGGLAQSFARKGNLKHDDRVVGKVMEPFALYCCVEDLPGSLGDVLANLSGVEFSDAILNKAESTLSMHLCRFQGCSGVHNYSFFANAELHDAGKKQKKGKIFCSLFQSESGDPERRRKTKESITKLLKVECVTGVLGTMSGLLRLRKICYCCDRRINCSIASYLRKIENLVKNRDYYINLEKTRKLPEGTVKKELERFFVNPDFHCSEINKEKYLELPRATILVCCRHSKVTGSLSTAINNLLLKKVERTIQDGNDVADITYLRSYECYNPSLTHIEFYGNWISVKNEERDTILKSDGVIDSVFLNVVTRKEEWSHYARTLCQSLNKIYNNESYELWTDSADSPNIFAVIRKAFIEGRCSDDQSPGKARLKCKKQKCIVHDKMRLLEDRLE